MNRLKKIAYNCKKATFLIEKKQIGTITLREKIELKIHLSGCVICRIFQQQSILINRTVKNLFQLPQYKTMKLEDDFKKELQQRIDKEIKKTL
ncbi:hypothetical protein SAMN05428988_4448 [Chitinophaga sp. YR573]|uniref:hypothetical protein n=1 Tax=Chitinophaga sp. YR573 TaxID=1881040 RepID=UPI0008C8BC9A|nr:hypothetical protein [Chitinophaga sp. YR573]SEW36127.1 hypothetical protein SAMN05428988_4448 [Chitinophaga sp. YR573]